MSIYIGLDLSFAKTGYAVVEVINGKPKLLDYGLIKNDPNQTEQERIEYNVIAIDFLASQYRPNGIVKEASVVGRSSTAMPVLKTHGAYELRMYSRYKLFDFHNASIKKWARNVLNVKDNDKKMVGEAVERKYGTVDGLYTPRGKYIDDIGDAIACVTAFLEREEIIEKGVNESED